MSDDHPVKPSHDEAPTESGGDSVSLDSDNPNTDPISAKPDSLTDSADQPSPVHASDAEVGEAAQQQAASASTIREESSVDDIELLKRASREFAVYCDAEIHHRRNSGEAFDEGLFKEAVEMTVRRLKALESGGMA